MTSLTCSESNLIQADVAKEAARICEANPGAQTRHIQKPGWNEKRASTSMESGSESDAGYIQVSMLSCWQSQDCYILCFRELLFWCHDHIFLSNGLSLVKQYAGPRYPRFQPQ